MKTVIFTDDPWALVVKALWYRSKRLQKLTSARQEFLAIQDALKAMTTIPSGQEAFIAALSEQDAYARTQRDYSDELGHTEEGELQHDV